VTICERPREFIFRGRCVFGTFNLSLPARNRYIDATTERSYVEPLHLWMAVHVPLP